MPSPSVRLWWSHVRVPLATFVVLAYVFATTRADLVIARAYFFDGEHLRWMGTHSWWVNEFVHTGGRWLIRAIIAMALALLAASCLDQSLRVLRRPAAYFVVATLLSIGIVGLLKTVTNVDCPWDLLEFGGRFPFIELFGDRPDALRLGRCFPAAHSSSGYAMLCLYFVLRERHAAWARVGLLVGIATGLVFGIAQQSRGAHFVSHDVWSAAIVWLTTTSVYAFGFRSRLWQRNPSGFAFDESSPATRRLVAGGAVAVDCRTRGLPRSSRERGPR